jgi:cytochrome c-type biogenesis protein CcmE
MQRTKFIVGGILILAAVAYLIFSSTKASAEYFMTVEEVQSQTASLTGKNLRVSGAVIGDNCIIAAGAVITKDMEVGANSLVAGVPGKFLREVSDNEAMNTRQSAARYAQRGQHYKTGLKLLARPVS